MKTLAIAATLCVAIAPASAQNYQPYNPSIQFQRAPQPAYQGQFFDTGGGYGVYQDNRGGRCVTSNVGGQIIVNCD